MYKKASQQGLRIATPKGELSIEQLWQLGFGDLSKSIKAVKKILKTTDDDELSFLEDAKVIDVTNQLRFDILKDVYLTKRKDKEALRAAIDTKAHNQKILQLMEDKKEEGLKEMSVEELEKMLK